MEKYGSGIINLPKDDGTKTAGIDICPKCGSQLLENTNVIKCSNCGVINASS